MATILIPSIISDSVLLSMIEIAARVKAMARILRITWAMKKLLLLEDLTAISDAIEDPFARNIEKQLKIKIWGVPVP